MSPRTLSALATLLALQAASVAANPAERLAVWEWRDVPRVVAVGDLHGGYDKLVKLLEGAELVDGELRWRGGEAHLVVAGDLLDRGDGERPLMDLLRRLQGESEAAGGRVHVLLGNHEAMNLVRDTRDVSKRALAAFADLESKQERKAALKAFAAGNGRMRPALGVFNERFPRGFFGRQKALDADGEYGSWLLRQPAIVKIDGIVYLHGGLTEDFASLGVDGINRQLLDQLQRHVEQRGVLQAAGLVTPVMGYLEVRQAAEDIVRRSGRRVSAEVREAARAVVASADSPILGARGPLWYRGNSFEDERIESSILARCLELLDAEAMVVAHSYTGSNRITSRFHGQLYRLDHGITYSKRPLALVAEKGEIMVLDSSTRRVSEPYPEPPNGLAQPPESVEVSAEGLERFLSQAKVTESRELGRGKTRPLLVVLERGGERRRGLFKTVEEPEAPDTGVADRYQHEVAAYRLARRLGLELVPATVIREIDGRRGSLQWWVKGAVDREAAQAYGLELCASADRRLADVRVFDALIGNPGREPSDVLCVVTSERVFLIDHSEAFPASRDLPTDGGGALAPTPALAAALRQLDLPSLTADLGELLNAGQIDALLARRDEILASAQRQPG